MFCGRPAWRRPAPCDFAAHDFDCVRCGRYRVGETAEARMRGNGMSLYASVLPRITGANLDGFRLVIPSCYCVPLSDEREVAIVAHADRPANQPDRQRLATRTFLGTDRPAGDSGTHRSA
jgi:hypothetical protein